MRLLHSKTGLVAGEQSKTVETIDPIDRPTSSDKCKVTLEKCPRSGQESQMEIWDQQTTGLEPVTSVMHLRQAWPCVLIELLDQRVCGSRHTVE